VLVAGGAGGPTIITAVFQVMSNVVDFGMNVVDAVDAPRFHQQHMPDVVITEKDGVSAATRQGLEAMGYTLQERGHIADAPAIGVAAGPGMGWLGAAEPRRVGGLAAGW
jgi:gamma-glutamyltranspeptidase/glutathione hydrolase